MKIAALFVNCEVVVRDRTDAGPAEDEVGPMGWKASNIHTAKSHDCPGCVVVIVMLGLGWQAGMRLH